MRAGSLRSGSATSRECTRGVCGDHEPVTHRSGASCRTALVQDCSCARSGMISGDDQTVSDCSCARAGTEIRFRIFRKLSSRGANPKIRFRIFVDVATVSGEGHAPLVERIRFRLFRNVGVRGGTRHVFSADAATLSGEGHVFSADAATVSGEGHATSSPRTQRLRIGIWKSIFMLLSNRLVSVFI